MKIVKASNTFYENGKKVTMSDTPITEERGGKTLPGLVKRRKSESELYFKTV